MEIITKDFTMNNNDNTIEQQLHKYAETIKRIHDELIDMPYSFEENKEQSKRILGCAGDLYRAYITLKRKNEYRNNQKSIKDWFEECIKNESKKTL